MHYKIILTLLFCSVMINAVNAETINFGNSFFNKDRTNTISKVINIQNNTENAMEYTIAFTAHPSMQTSDIKITPLTDDVYDVAFGRKIIERLYLVCLQIKNAGFILLSPLQK